MVIQRSKPVADQAYELLKERIEKGDYLPDSRLPSEERLSKELGISRATIRTALARIEMEGLIHRRPGDGTYINRYAVDIATRPGTIWEMARQIEESGRRASICTIKAMRRKANPEEANELRIDPEKEVLFFKRLFLADNTPIMLSQNTIPAAILQQDFDREAVNLPINEFLIRYCSRRIAYVIADFLAVAVNHEVANHLQINQGDPILLLKEVFYDEHSEGITLGINYRRDFPVRMRVAQSPY